MSLTHAALKARQRAERGRHPPGIAVRIHRALSWLGRAERCGGDGDARFIFLWIAFNAAYANEIPGEEFTEKKIFRNFIKRLVELDQDHLLADLIWTEFPGAIRILLGNRYVYEPFWDFHRGNIGEQEWKIRFSRKKSATTRAFARNNTAGVLISVFSSLYVLRNQIMHGGATWNSAVNRDQVRDCTNILAKAVPLVIQILMDNPDALWGDPVYPVIE
ncbi:MAG: hypothetical protein ACR2P7_01370 [bacterium]